MFTIKRGDFKNVNEKNTFNYNIIIDDIDILCNISNQYIVYKNYFQKYPRLNKKNMIHEIMENNKNITEKLFPLFLYQLKQMVFSFYFIDLPQEILLHPISFYCIFKEINKKENYTISFSQSNKKTKLYHNEKNIQILFRDILCYFYQKNNNLIPQINLVIKDDNQ